MYLNIKTGYSFKAVFATIDNIVEHCLTNQASFAGIADTNNTFGHAQWEESCLMAGIKPIFGVTLPVYHHTEQGKEYRRIQHNVTTFIALNMKGLTEIYNLVDLAYQNFYYTPRISFEMVNQLSKNILILSGHSPKYITHKNLYNQMSPDVMQYALADRKGIACISNSYINEDDKNTYESFAEPRLVERRTTPQHIMTYQEWSAFFPEGKKALKNLLKIGNQIDFRIKKAKMVKIPDHLDIEKLCKVGAKKRGLNIKTGKYAERYKREMKLIKKKGYVDYFLIVADLIKFAKGKMLVGPARGSAAGSLVCYLLEITEVNPLKYDLLFERFLDKNRKDLPDIDIDFQDDKRNLVIAYLKTKYGSEKVAQIGNISRLQHKSALNRIAKALFIPLEAIEESKISDDSDNQSFKKLIKKYPPLADVKKMIGHPLHTSIHAAGIIVAKENISNFCGLNSRDQKHIVAMVDKNDAEKINLLKIDALGLRTLTILSDALKLIGKSNEWLYSRKLTDKKTFKIFNQFRFQGIFQFEGEAVQNLSKRIKVKTLEDLSILSAIARPGALSSGGAERYIKRRLGESKVKYLDKSKSFVKITKPTFGVIVFQEQVMKIAREYAGLSWVQVGALRKAVAKSKGLADFHKMFVKSAIKNGHKPSKANKVWADIVTHGSYSFNVSHSISYAFITYFTAYLKAHYPIEFAVAALNHTKDDYSGLKFLRDMVENSGIEYEYFNPEYSVQKWSIRDGTLVGGLLSMDGIGPVAANKFVKCRRELSDLPEGLRKNIFREDTVYKYLYPAREVYGHYYASKKVSEIKNIQRGSGEKFIFIGRLAEMKTRDLNEARLVEKRRGQLKDGNTTFIQFKIEDDTDSISCVIWSDLYKKFGKKLAETGTEKDWYFIKGEMSNGMYRSINVKRIKRITKK